MIGAEVRVVEKREKHAEGRFGGLKHVIVVIRVRPVRQGQDRIWKQDRLVLLIADEVLILLVEVHSKPSRKITYLSFQHEGTVDKFEGANPDKYVLARDRVLDLLRARAGTIPLLGETGLERRAEFVDNVAVDQKPILRLGTELDQQVRIFELQTGK
jgi:hypothetical protein